MTTMKFSRVKAILNVIEIKISLWKFLNFIIELFDLFCDINLMKSCVDFFVVTKYNLKLLKIWRCQKAVYGL